MRVDVYLGERFDLGFERLLKILDPVPVSLRRLASGLLLALRCSGGLCEGLLFLLCEGLFFLLPLLVLGELSLEGGHLLLSLFEEFGVGLESLLLQGLQLLVVPLDFGERFLCDVLEVFSYLANDVGVVDADAAICLGSFMSRAIVHVVALRHPLRAPQHLKRDSHCLFKMGESLSDAAVQVNLLRRPLLAETLAESQSIGKLV